MSICLFFLMNIKNLQLHHKCVLVYWHWNKNTLVLLPQPQERYFKVLWTFKLFDLNDFFVVTLTKVRYLHKLILKPFSDTNMCSPHIMHQNEKRNQLCWHFTWTKKFKSAISYLFGSTPVEENAIIALFIISLRTRSKFLDRYRPWEAKHMTNFISR